MFSIPSFVSSASGEREDALPQTPECTDCSGLFKEAAGEDQLNWPQLLPVHIDAREQ